MHARTASCGTANLEFCLAESGSVPRGPWDAARFADVRYLLPESEQHRLVTEAVFQRMPGGLVVIEETGTEPAWEVRWNTAHDSPSVGVLRVTAGSDFDFMPPSRTA